MLAAWPLSRPFMVAAFGGKEFVLHITGDMARIANDDENAFLREALPNMWRFSDSVSQGEFVVSGGFYRIYG